MPRRKERVSLLKGRKATGRNLFDMIVRWERKKSNRGEGVPGDNIFHLKDSCPALSKHWVGFGGGLCQHNSYRKKGGPLGFGRK